MTLHRAVIRVMFHVIVFAPVFAAIAQAQSPTGASAVTAATGESWLKHLNRRFDQTSMGRSSWKLGPRPGTAEAYAATVHPVPLDQLAGHTARVTGADLYRFNCQGCHGSAGQGAPPEINSLINPVRATSASMTLERMKSLGMEMSPADANKMAREAKTALLQRLHNGGENMPSFAYLSEAEIRSLTSYLKQLAALPGAVEEQSMVPERPERVGELVVKSTCHTCHDAVGSNPGPDELLQGAIPPLSSLTTRKDEGGLVEKVTHGAGIAMGPLATAYGGRMPVFDYLSESDASAVYLYLTKYPPEAAPPAESPRNDERAQASVAAATNSSRPSGPSGGAGSGAITAIVFSAATAFSFGLIIAGCVFTAREFSRLNRPRSVFVTRNTLASPGARGRDLVLTGDEKQSA